MKDQSKPIRDADVWRGILDGWKREREGQQFKVIYRRELAPYIYGKLLPAKAAGFSTMGTFRAKSLDDLFAIFNDAGEVPNPLGTPEGQQLVRAKTDHTSMSVGDIIQDEKGRYFMVAPFGFDEVELVSYFHGEVFQAKKAAPGS